MRKLLIASSNRGKIEEIKKIISDLPFNITGMGKYPELKKVNEDGDSFTANALKKARQRADETGLLTLADDSGLEVEYLEGKPGIYSARFAGPDASDKDNNRELLQLLKGVPPDKRRARFKCVIAIVDPLFKREFTVDGICEGRILKEPRGSNGFGYDPLLFIPQFGKTMAELTMAEKNKISHRANALARAKNVLSKKITRE